MVAERSRASYLIGVLGMLKVEGSNPGVAVIFRAEKLNCIGNGRVRTKNSSRINSQSIYLSTFGFSDRNRSPRRVA